MASQRLAPPARFALIATALSSRFAAWGLSALSQPNWSEQKTMANDTATTSTTTKKKTANAAAPTVTAAPQSPAAQKADALARASEFETSAQVQLKEEDFVEVDFNRLWYRTKKGQNPISFLPLAKSKDMRGEFKSKYPGDKSPCFMLACELMHDVSAADQTLYSGEEPVAAAKGDVFYMIEPKRCASKLDEALARAFICRMQATEKVEIKSREHGTVYAWDYRLSIRPMVTVTVIDVPSLMMPVGEEIEAVEEP